jgi:hypothetical protein
VFRSSTSTPNKGELATHFHGSLARMNGKEGFNTTCDFSTKQEESTLYHSHSIRSSPISPSKVEKV